ncbi:MAG: M3 family metallopeptidase, partial [Myxococcales bacterium]
MGSNPLLELDFDLPFDRIRAEHVEPAVAELLEEAKAKLAAIAAENGPRTWQNTVRALEAATERLELAMTVVGHLESVATNPALRDAYNKVEPEVSGFFASIALDPGLYAALKAYAQTDEAKALTGAKKRLLKKTLDDFRRHGAELPPEGKKRLEALSRQLAELTTKFSQNTLDATSAFELLVEDEAKLAGLPESAREAARAAAQAKGQKGWRFTLHAPSYIPVMTYLDDASIREKMFRAFNARATAGERDNRPLIGRILELRREKANLLGYRTFADLVLEDRMAHDGARAQAFVRDLREKKLPHFERENQELERFRKELEGTDAP